MIEKFKNLEIAKEAQKNTLGGRMTVEELLQHAWDMTPENGSSHWVNNGYGTFWGATFEGPAGFIDVNTGEVGNTWP